MAKRHLSDLFLVGEEVTFDDGMGDPVKVFIRKLNPVEHEKALRRANAARARVNALKKHPENDEYQDLWNSIALLEKDGLVAYLVEDARSSLEAVIEAETADADDWKTDNYLEGLQDKWANEFKDVYAKNPDDPDASHCFAELQRFYDDVEKEVSARLADQQEDFQKREESSLQAMVLEKFLAMKASVEWLTEFRRCEIWLSARDPEDKVTRIFENREDVDTLPAEVFTRIADVYRRISVEPMEGKDSRAAVSSSASSDTPASPATEDPSTPEDAAA